FFNDTATTEIYPLSLHDALPIYPRPDGSGRDAADTARARRPHRARVSDDLDRKSTRLNCSHTVISYAVFCLKKMHNVNFLEQRAHMHRHSAPLRTETHQ